MKKNNRINLTERIETSEANPGIQPPKKAIIWYPCFIQEPVCLFLFFFCLSSPSYDMYVCLL
jgi:hypothetical protein